MLDMSNIEPNAKPNAKAPVVIILSVMLGALGLYIGWSALQHWLGSPEMLQHYEATPLGARGQVWVAVAQTFAAVCLLWPRLQVLAGLILGTVLFAASIRQLVVAGLTSLFWQPFLLGAGAVTVALLLLRAKRRAAR